MASTPSPSHPAHFAGEAGLAELLAQTGAPITARPTWWSAWLRAFGQDPLLITLPNARAAAPLASDSSRHQVEIQVLGGPQSDQARLPAMDAPSGRALADLLMARLSEFNRPWHLCLAQLPADDPTAQRLAEVLPRSEWRLAPDLASPSVTLHPGTTLEDYLGRTSRKGHRRTARHFAQAGGSVSHTRDPERIEALLPELARIRRARDHRCGRVSELDSPSGYRFWELVLTEHAAAGELEVALATVNNKLVAYDVILLDGAAERLWDGRVAPEAESLSVGRLLQDVALTRALDRGAVELDLMRGVTPAKLRLATDIRVAAVFEAWSSGYRRGLTRTSRSAVGSIKRVRDSNDRLDGLWRHVKQRTLLRGASLHEHSDLTTGGAR